MDNNGIKPAWIPSGYTEKGEKLNLKAVKLGQDTDTTGAVTGGLAALLYGYDNIPKHWLSQLAHKDDIEDLTTRMFKVVQ